MYLVDTNVLSEARRKDKRALGWFRSVDPSAVYLSVVTLGEIAKGANMKARRDRHGATVLLTWLQQLRRDHESRILPVTDRIALEWGRIAALRPRGVPDGLIAATAVVHDLIVVTRNSDDFNDTGVTVVNPWDEPLFRNRG